MSEAQIFDWDDSDEQWQDILGETYRQGKSFIRFPNLYGVNVLYVEDLLSIESETE